MKNELRAYFGLKSVRGWEQYGSVGYVYWKLRGLSTEQIWDKLQEEYEKRKEVSAKRIQRAFRKRALRAKSVTTRSFKDIGVFDNYMFDVSETEEGDILAELRQMMFMSVPTVAGALYGFELFGNGTKRHVPPQKTKAEAVKAVQRELRNLTLNYLEWQINDVAIRVIKPDASVGKGGRSFIQASKAWVIVSPNTNANCAFSACVLSINRDTYRWLLEKGERRLIERSADLKRYVNPSNKKRTHVDDLQDIADYKKTEIVLYNNVFHKIRRFEPSGEIGKKDIQKLNRRPIEI